MQCALISTYDKQGIVELVSALSSLGIDIIATGGTYQHLKKAGIHATEISDYTNFPEIMNGRVKSLHPKIYAGILARRNEQNDHNTLKEHQYPLIDLVVCNLYPFKKTISKKDSTLSDAIEHIDIGGPTMIRAAAKNFQDVTILTDPNDYSTVLNEIQTQGNTSPTTRQLLATKAFGLVAHYNTTINQHCKSR